MIIHNVFFKVKPTVSQEAIDNAFKLLFKLQTQLPGILKITGGECHFHESKGAGFFTHGFSIDFADGDAYNTFFESPLATPAKGCILNLTEGGYEGLFGFDMGEFDQIRNSSSNRKYRIQAPRLRLTPPGGLY